MKKKILILVVTYNAELTIGKLLNRFPKSVLEEATEILVADDCSQDNTYKIAIDYKNKKQFQKLKVIKHKQNKGYGGNQKWGYNYAIENKFDIVVMVHGDCQYPPEDVPDLIKPLKQDKADFVFGSRIAGQPLKGNMPLYKFIGNKFLTFCENLAFRTNLSEFHSGFRAYSVSALKEIPFNKNSDVFHFDSEIIIQLIIAKKRIKEIVIPTCYGEEKCNVNSIGYGFAVLNLILEYLLQKYNIKKYDKFNIK
ncbi:glycosyltransferase family 2 protein [Candidatus Pacearchaeota archaeon]|nr:glycosyltransferase family 2 protein [Candidatus Pacearchaeota archaeon]